ncbi:MAG: peptide ABC transporter ATP-binding protein [Desulfobacterales bacterium C00003106]|jgi:oligopeptide/dipeptide ABC transporter ATP-binding protein|nr:MAG: peptide ABC transporter ATP-binding protein [Desulfobacterales bacterium C00003106]OEU58152.1 MAG: peptide ABC transporter ATP-binding protein [Desulfobacterales bacterium C00003104]
MSLLDVRDLRTSFYTDQGVVHAVDGVSFSVERGKTLGIVGESGCGKSVTALSVMRLVPERVGRIESGTVLFDGRDILKLKEREMQNVRGNSISMIFQDPMTSLNPVFTVGNQIAEVLHLHRKLSAKEALKIAETMLRQVGMPDPHLCVNEYPHRLSGGMRQRVMIAMALSCKPRLIIADEPTTALDVTIQAQILELLMSLQEKHGMSIIMITHNLGVIAEVADDVLVIYAGHVIEENSVDGLFRNPLHPYTKGLLASVPKLTDKEMSARLPTIPGSVPDLISLPSGCRFADRCSDRFELCERMPDMVDVGGGHRVRCWKYN